MAQQRILHQARATSGREAARTTAPLSPSPLHPVLELHATIGNRAARRLMEKRSNGQLQRDAALGTRGAVQADGGAPQRAPADGQAAGAKGTAWRGSSAEPSHEPVIQCMPKGRKRKYGEGTHGSKKAEQKRLKLLYGIDVSGDTHESEHAIGFEPLNQTSGLKRGTAGRARKLENEAPAYQEVESLHREHIGTGTKSTPDASGFTSKQYRDAQRSLLAAEDVSSAVQLNQLGYAFDPDFATNAATQERKAADDSYNTMVNNMNSITYAQGDDDKTVSVTPQAKAEMHLARLAATENRYPTLLEEMQIRVKYGVE